MKKGLMLIGLPVIAIEEGKKVGQVIDLLINPHTMRLAFLLVGQDSRYIDLRLLSFPEVIGLGEYAVTTENEEELYCVEDRPEVRECLEASIDVMNKIVLTRRGDLEGMVEDFCIDDRSGEIIELEYKAVRHDMRLEKIKIQDIVSLGQDVVIIQEGRQIQRTNCGGEAGALSAALPPQKKQGAVLFKQKQRQFLMGKEVQKDIFNGRNQVIIPKGTVVTGEVLDVAEDHDRFSELTQWAQ